MDVGAAVAEWYSAGHRDLPWRRRGFSAWGTLVSEFMLQQTPVTRVIPSLEAWLARWPTPAALAAVPPGEAVRAWDRLGYPRRALALHGAATAIAERHHDVVPSDVDELLALPGVGPYTARAVAAFAYGVRTPVVDTNVRRVLARAVRGQAEAGPPSTARDLAEWEDILPEDPARARLANAGAMELGQTVCTARAPRCEECPILDACAWRGSGYPPYTGRPAARQARYEGSDRQVRGLVLAELRRSEVAVPATEIARLWADATQLDRAVSGLIADGLVVPDGDGYALP